MIIAEAKLAFDALKVVYEILKSSRLKKKDRVKIEKQAERIIQIATAEDVDRYVADPRRATIDQMTAKASKRRGRPPSGKLPVKRLNVPKKRGTISRTRTTATRTKH